MRVTPVFLSALWVILLRSEAFLLSPSLSTRCISRSWSLLASGRDGDIDLKKAISDARNNLAEGTSPGAGLEDPFAQADAAYADLIVTSIDSQGLDLSEEDVFLSAFVSSTSQGVIVLRCPTLSPTCAARNRQEVDELAQAGMMDTESTSKKSKGLFGDIKDVFGALGGGAHIVKRDDSSV
ncbi:unnamed protein product [Choristocarpus tenellus]